MSNSQISTFDFKSNPVRVELVKNEPHFCLTDVCIALDISNANSSRFKFNEAGVHKMYISFPSGKKEVTFINEPNLYRIIFRSNKANAVEFQNWVFEEVLPQIRKTGKYHLEPKQLALPEPEPTITVELNVSELKKLVAVWLQFTRFSERVGSLIRAFGLHPESHQHNERGVVFNHQLCQQNLKDTTDIVKRLSQLIPQEPKRLN